MDRKKEEVYIWLTEDNSNEGNRNAYQEKNDLSFHLLGCSLSITEFIVLILS